MKWFYHLRILIGLGLRYVEEDIRCMRVSGYDVEAMPELQGRRDQRALGRWLLSWLPMPRAGTVIFPLDNRGDL